MVRRTTMNEETLEGLATRFAPLRPVMQFSMNSLIIVGCFVAATFNAKAEI